MEEIGILPRFKGAIVHDYWKSYYHYDCNHSLCNIHNIRELKVISELTGQKWPEEVARLLLEIKERVDSGPLKDKEKIAFTANAMTPSSVKATALDRLPNRPRKEGGLKKPGLLICSSVYLSTAMRYWPSWKTYSDILTTTRRKEISA